MVMNPALPVDFSGAGNSFFGNFLSYCIHVRIFHFCGQAAVRLEANNILTNFQALPDDETFYHPSGIRMGVQEMTRFGMKEPDFDELARLMADVIVKKRGVAEEAAQYRSRFNTMQYCLTPEETSRLAPAVLESLFPNREGFLGFAAAVGNLG